jgi:GT2 family glycosyltransferase
VYWRSVASNSDSRGHFAGSGEHPPTRSLVDQQPPEPAAVPRRLGRILLLTLQVHCDAFRQAPLTYLQAAGWRLRGFRVRSRNRIAPLLGRSPRAYRLWIARSEPTTVPAADTASIVPVIDCRDGRAGLDETLASIACSNATARPVLIGGEAVAGTLRIARPVELAGLVPPIGAWLCPLAPGDRLARGALAIYAAEVATTHAALIYADDDLLSADGERRDPHFKPQWNADLFEHHDYLSGASIVRVTAEGVAFLPDRQWAQSLVAAAVSSGDPPRHVPRVLHHRRRRPDPALPPRVPAPSGTPDATVSVIIPTRNHAALLEDCLRGLRRVDYAAVETIVIDNGSDDPAALAVLAKVESDGGTVLRLPGAFNFSALNNEAVRHATGDYLCFLNNDVEMIDDDWLRLLVRQASRANIGAVGARLLYPDHTVQHAGVFTGIGGGAGHGHRFQRADDSGYFERARLPQQVSAVTAACLVVAREKFAAVGGFDETDFPVAFNDVDLCLKLNARGWQSFYEPRATLIHHESKSRGKDSARSNRVRFAGELAALKRKWRTDAGPDPFHHPHLSPFSEQFLVAV